MNYFHYTATFLVYMRLLLRVEYVVENMHGGRTIGWKFVRQSEGDLDPLTISLTHAEYIRLL